MSETRHWTYGQWREYYAKNPSRLSQIGFDERQVWLLNQKYLQGMRWGLEQAAVLCDEAGHKELASRLRVLRDTEHAAVADVEYEKRMRQLKLQRSK